MKNAIYTALQLCIPAALFAAIIYDGLTLKTAHHSGTQSNVTYNSHK